MDKFKEVNKEEFEELLNKYSIFKINKESTAIESDSIIIYEAYNKMSDIDMASVSPFMLMTSDELHNHIITNNIKHISVFQNILPMSDTESLISELVDRSIIEPEEGSLMHESIHKYPNRKEFTFERLDYSITIKIY